MSESEYKEIRSYQIPVGQVFKGALTDHGLPVGILQTIES